MNTRSKDIEEEMWDSAEILAASVEKATQFPNTGIDSQRRDRINDVLKASKTFTERYRAYVEHLTRLT